MLISASGGAIVVTICEVKIIRYFGQFGSTLSEKTRQMHKEFQRALLAMAICPLATSGLPVSFFLVTSMLSIVPGPMSAFFTTALSSIAVFNPLTTIFFMRCYRDVVFRCFRMQRSQRIVDATTVV
ncbi:hypothetical protein AAVH_30465 [Aphelenchoides avenae]|nr:hypothetical protein AAVH_30465 [Aphelenchus avenae]